MKSALFILLFSLAMSHAATYYVATNGSNANPGSEGEPWLTVNYAAENAPAGSTVLINAGRYNETPRADVYENVTYRAIGGEVHLNGFDLFTNNLTLDGLTFKEWSQNLTIYIRRGTASNTVQNCVFTILTNTIGVFFDTTGSTPANGPRWTVINSNYFSHISGTCITINGAFNLVTSNVFENTYTGADAIRCFGATNRISRNTFRYMTRGGGPSSGGHPDPFQTFGDTGYECYDILLDNNLIHDCDTQVTQISMDGVANIRNIYFINNIVANMLSYANSGASNMVWANNLFYKISNTLSDAAMATRDTTNEFGTSAGTILWNNAFVECGADPAKTNAGWYSVSGELRPHVILDHNFVAGTGGAAKATQGFDETYRIDRFVETNGISGGDPLFNSTAGLDFTIPANSVLSYAGAPVPFNFPLFPGEPFDIARDFADRPRTEGQWSIGPFEPSGGSIPTRHLRAINFRPNNVFIR